MKSKIIRIIALVIIALFITSGVVFAATYSANIQVQETDGNNYDSLPIMVSVNNTYLIDNGYIDSTGLDTKVLSGDTELPHIIADNMTLFVIPSVSSYSTGNYKYTLGNSDITSFPIITGYEGHVTINNDSSMEPSDNYSIELDTYINSNANAGLILSKSGALYLTVSPITANEIDAYIDCPVVNSTSNNSQGSASSISVTLPTGYTDGDLILVFISNYHSSGSPYTISIPSGWVQLYQGKVTDTSGYSNAGFYRIIDGDTSPVSFSFSGTANGSSYCAYRITNYCSVPMAGTTIEHGASSTKPDSPNLITGFGNVPTRYFSAILSRDSQSIYPTNYTTDVISAGGTYYYTYVGTRNYISESDNPGTYDTATYDWIANTIAIQGKYLSVSNILSDKYHVILSADTINSSLTIGSSSNTTALNGIFVPPNDADWILGSNATPYINYFKEYVNGTLRCHLEPTEMIIGNIVTDESGLYESNPGYITWGTNPDGISISKSSLIPSNQPILASIPEGNNPNVVPSGNIPSGGTVDTTKLQNNPIYPIIKAISDNTNLSEEQIWFIGATLIILIGMGIALVKVSNHMLLAGLIGFILSGFFTAMSIYQWWMLLIFGFVFIMSILMERKPVV